MAAGGNFLFNRARGSAHEMYRIVNDNTLANAALKLIVLADDGGLEDDEILRDYDSLSAILASSNDEPLQAQYNRKTLDDTVLAAATVDDSLDTVTLFYPTQTWTAVVAGDAWGKLLTCIDYDTTSGDDTNIVPITAQAMLVNGVSIVPSGVDIQWSVTTGFYISEAT